MADQEVDVPGIGGMKRSWVIGGVSVAGGYVLYRYWKARRDAAAAPVPVAGDATVADGGPSGPYQNPAPGAGGATYQAGSASGSAPQTDQAWTAAVVQDLGNLGYNPQTVAEAVAAYLGQQPLTADQVVIIRLAWAYEGRPPGHPSLPIIQGGNPVPAPTPDPIPDPTPTPTPTPAPTPAPAQHRYPEWQTSHVNVPGDNYTKLAGQYGLNMTGQELYDYQFSAEAGRPAATQVVLRQRGPGLIYAGGETEIPYPK